MRRISVPPYDINFLEYAMCFWVHLVQAFFSIWMCALILVALYILLFWCESSQVWSLSGGKLLRNIVFPSIIDAVVLDPGEHVFYAGGRDGKIYIAALNAQVNSSSNYGFHIIGSLSEHKYATSFFMVLAFITLYYWSLSFVKLGFWQPLRLDKYDVQQLR